MADAADADAGPTSCARPMSDGRGQRERVDRATSDPLLIRRDSSHTRAMFHLATAGIPRDRHGRRHRHGHILADFRARIVASMSACPATSPFSLPRAGHARRSSPTCPTRALFLARMSVRNARVYTCKRVLYTISYRVQNYTIGTSLMSVSVPWNSSFIPNSHYAT